MFNWVVISSKVHNAPLCTVMHCLGTVLVCAHGPADDCCAESFMQRPVWAQECTVDVGPLHISVLKIAHCSNFTSQKCAIETYTRSFWDSLPGARRTSHLLPVSIITSATNSCFLIRFWKFKPNLEPWNNILVSQYVWCTSIITHNLPSAYSEVQQFRIFWTENLFRGSNSSLQDNTSISRWFWRETKFYEK